MKEEQKKEIIIPGTSGVITYLSNQINKYVRRKDSIMLRDVTEIIKIVEGRIAGIPLEELLKGNNRIVISNCKKVEPASKIHSGGIYEILCMVDEEQ